MRELRADLKTLLRPPTHLEPPVSSGAAAPAPMSAREPVSAPMASSREVSIPPPAMPSVSLPPPTAAPAPEHVERIESRPQQAPDWLEDKAEGYARFLNGMTSGVIQTQELASVLSRDPVPWLKRFVEERDPHLFEQQATELDRAVRVLAHRGDAKALWAVSSAVHGLAVEAARVPDERAETAAALLRLFADPGMLGPIADRLLAYDDDARDAARTLLVRARVAGAYALYGSRVKLATHPGVRAPFVATMSELGEASWPVVRAALAKIPSTAQTGGHPLAANLAEDLLLSVPPIRDEAAGQLIGSYVHAWVPALSQAAARALARVCPENARAVLVGMLAAADDGPRLAAIAGLRESGAIDGEIAYRLAPLLVRGGASHEVRLAALDALTTMTLEARPVAVPALVQLVQDPAVPDDATLLGAARALVAAVGLDARLIVEARAERAPPSLRSHLLALLG